MTKIIILVVVVSAAIFLGSCFWGRTKTSSPSQLTASTASTVYGIKLMSLDGKKEINLEDYKGKKILIVNVASECGYTPQYEGLQALYTKYSDKLEIVGCPCNQFGGQESGDSAQISSFCKKNFGVTFPLSQKLEVKGGNQHALYQWLTQKAKNGMFDTSVTWNFNKFLIGTDGKLLAYFPSNTKPDDAKLIEMINQ